MKIAENSIIKGASGIELLLAKEIQGLYIAINYGNLCDRSKYLVEPHIEENGDAYIRVIKRLKPDVAIEEQIEQALRDKDADEEDVIVPPCTTDEEKIVRQIKEVLEEEELYYSFDYNICPSFCVNYEHNNKDNKESIMTLQYMLGVIDVDIPYPVDIPTKCRGIIALYVCEHNDAKFTRWKFNIEDGTLSMEFKIMIDGANYFEKSSFKKQLRLTINNFFKEADQIDQLCKGIVAEEKLVLYWRIFMNGLVTIKKEKSIAVQDNKTANEGDDRDEINKYIDRIGKGEIPTFREFVSMMHSNMEEEGTVQNNRKLPFVDAI